MSGSVEALSQAVAVMADNNISAQMTTAEGVFFLITSSFGLTEQWSATLVKDQYKYYTDSLNVIQDPNDAALAAADYATYTMDSNKMDSETGFQNNLLQNDKTQVRTESNSMDQVYSMEEPLSGLLKSTTRAILMIN